MQGGGGLIVLAGPGDLQSDRYAAAVPAFRDVVNRLKAFLELQSALPPCQNPRSRTITCSPRSTCLAAGS